MISVQFVSHDFYFLFAQYKLHDEKKIVFDFYIYLLSKDRDPKDYIASNVTL